MHIEQSHHLSKEEAKNRVEALASNLAGMQLAGDVTIGDLSKSWTGDTMDFSFRVKRGFFGADIKGQIVVSDSTVTLNIKVPPIVSKFIDEERVRDIIKNKMAEMLT